MFITLQHEHTDRPFDSMNLWLENVGRNEFHVCMRELMTFDGIHSDLKVVSLCIILSYDNRMAEDTLRHLDW